MTTRGDSIQTISRFLTRSIAPAAFLNRALYLIILFVIVSAWGLRHYTCVISGTSPDGEPIGLVSALSACLYLFSYFSFFCVVPVFLMTWVFLLFLKSRIKQKKTGKQ